MRSLPFYDDMAKLVARDGAGALASMPADWWAEIGPIGTMDDAVAFVRATHAAGAHHINMFPAPELSIGVSQIADAAALKRIVDAG